MAVSIAQARQFASLVYRGDFRAASKIFSAMIDGDFLPATITATAAQINAAAAPASRFVNVTDAAAYTVLAADSGKTHIMPDFTATCTLTLPTAAAGLEYTFIGKGVAADAQNWVFTAITPSFLKGGIVWEDEDSAGVEVASLYPNGSSHLTLTVVVPAGGTYVYLICDGTNWIVSANIVSATTPAFS